MTRQDDIFNLLRAENREAVTLLAGLVDEEDETRRASLFGLVRDRLLRHAQAEAEVYYGELEQFEATREDAMTGRREYGRVKTQLEAIGLCSPDRPDWPDRIDELKKSFEKHARREEISFRRARGVLPKHRRHWLGGRYLEALVAANAPVAAGTPHAAAAANPMPRRNRVAS